MSSPPSSRTLHVAEPSTQFLARPAVVVDASVLCAVIFDEAERQEAMQLLAGRQLWAPRLLDHEVINVAAKKQRRGLSTHVVQQALSSFLEHQIDMVNPAPIEQYVLAARYGLSGYDAAYLWLAAAMRVPLLTFDRKLAVAAKTHLESLR